MWLWVSSLSYGTAFQFEFGTQSQSVRRGWCVQLYIINQRTRQDLEVLMLLLPPTALCSCHHACVTFWLSLLVMLSETCQSPCLHSLTGCNLLTHYRTKAFLIICSFSLWSRTRTLLVLDPDTVLLLCFSLTSRPVWFFHQALLLLLQLRDILCLTSCWCK